MTALKFYAGDLVTVNSLYYGDYIALYLHKIESTYEDHNICRVMRQNDNVIFAVEITEIELLARARYGGLK